ncbi:MAG: hypothetical protein Q8O40_11815 [Chloroflexota bacterium]|nr:hypothetical protein [Chloroflexota bacterium]
MKLTMEVTVNCIPTTDEEEEAKANYQPTPEVQEPDAEWIAEHVAMNRISNAFLQDGELQVTIVDPK